MNNRIFDALATRRSQYNLTNKRSLSDNELEELLKQSLELTPSAFNSQAGRIVLLLNNNHKKLWNIVSSTLKVMIPANQWDKTASKLNGFASAYGTVLFFEDMETIEGLQKQFPLYHENFAVWSQHQAGMLQLTVWTALADNHLGASLQHYNPLIDDQVKQEFGLPAKWKLLAQMPFGEVVKPEPAKEKLPISKRLFVKK